MQTTTFTFTFTVASLLQVTSTPVPGGVVNKPYSFQLTATGGTPPYTWTATGLPTGLICSPSGLISGTPSTAGSYNVSVVVTDSGV